MTNLDRAMAYLEKLPDAISGAGGHDATLRAACECVRFGLTDGELWEALCWYNVNKCRPQWSEKELTHKIESAKTKAQHGERVQPARNAGKRRTFTPPDMTRRGLAASTTTPAKVATIGAQLEGIGAASVPSAQPTAAPAHALADLATIEAEIARSRARWASVLAAQPAIAAAWGAWRSAGNPPEGMELIAEATIAARVPWAEGQPFNPEPWRAWASGASGGNDAPPRPTAEPAADPEADYWQSVFAQEAAALALAGEVE